MKNKNILIVSHLYPNPGSETRGIFVHKQVLALKKVGYNVKVISPVVLGKKAPATQYSFEGIEVWAPKYLSGGRLVASFTGRTASWGVLQAFGKMNFRPDIILAHTALPDGGVAKILSKKLGVPYFVYVHGADVQHKINYNKRTQTKIINILAGAKKVLVNSSKTERLVGELDVGSVIVPMGVDEINTKYKIQNTKMTRDLKSEQLSSSTIKQLNHSTIRLISVCNLGKEKGLQYAIEALREIKNDDIEYLIIGDGEYGAELKRKAEGDERIRFLGRLGQEEVFDYLAESDVFVLPSYNEAFGVAYLEAMSFGLPVIGVRGEGVEDIFAKGKCGILVEPQSTKEVQKALETLLQSRDLREKMGAVGQEIVRSHYLWDKAGKNLIKELEK